jgi:hypothetical protein
VCGDLSDVIGKSAACQWQIRIQVAPDQRPLFVYDSLRTQPFLRTIRGLNASLIVADDGVGFVDTGLKVVFSGLWSLLL